MTKLALLIVAVLLAVVVLDGAAVHAQSTTPDRLAQLNILKGKSVADWQTQYDSLRRGALYNWVDWSQDWCSSPLPVTPYIGTFTPGCLRHDMMWRTLPIVDAGTGRVWNERNRLAADNQFKNDMYASCRAGYPPNSQDPRVRAQYTASTFAADRGYGGVRNAEDKYDDSDNPLETDDVALGCPVCGIGKFPHFCYGYGHEKFPECTHQDEPDRPTQDIVHYSFPATADQSSIETA